MKTAQDARLCEFVYLGYGHEGSSTLEKNEKLLVHYYYCSPKPKPFFRIVSCDVRKMCRLMALLLLVLDGQPPSKAVKGRCRGNRNGMDGQPSRAGVKSRRQGIKNGTVY